MNNIDIELNKRYTKSKYGELKAIYELVSDPVIMAIENSISKNFRVEKNYHQKIYIDYQWIDKIPLANFTNKELDINNNLIKSKVEIGDIFIQYRKSSPFKNKSKIIVNKFDRRSLVIQAKLSNTKIPNVPIGKLNKNKVNSTSKELKLLEHWPPFDLYETSRSKLSCLKNVQVELEPFNHSFFGGFNNKSKQWHFGFARYGTPCNIKYSELITGLCIGDYGRVFEKEDTAWSQLTEHINSIVHNRKIPKSISDKVQKCRNIRSKIQLNSFPSGIFDFFYSIFNRKKMLVIMIDQIDFEGHNIEELMI